MTNMLDYLNWRGDLPMDQAPFCPVDGLILSTLVYVHFDALVPPGLRDAPTLGETAETYLALPEDSRGRRRCKEDLALLAALAKSRRFAPLRLCFREERFSREEETQFAALAVLLEDGSAFLAFRGTDSTLVGWKEDFNMSFQDTVPAQRAALDYLEWLAAAFPGPLRLGGHSKGGNLAVFAGAMCREATQGRILAVYNNDGPGFTDYVLTAPGYGRLVPRIQTYVPQSSVIGMLLEHEEDYVVVKSDQIGILQHDPYSWEVMGGDFIRLETVDQGSRMTDRTVKNWLAGMTPEQRGRFVDTVFDLLTAGDAKTTAEMAQPKNVYAALRALGQTDWDTKAVLAGALGQLVRSAAEVLREEESG